MPFEQFLNKLPALIKQSKLKPNMTLEEFVAKINSLLDETKVGYTLSSTKVPTPVTVSVPESTKLLPVFEAFPGDLHLYALKNSKGEPVKTYQELKANGTNTYLYVLDFKNTLGFSLTNWKVQFDCPGLDLNQQMLQGATVSKSGDTYYLTSPKNTPTIAPYESLTNKIVFVSPQINGKTPIAMNFKLADNTNVPSVSTQGKVAKFDFGKVLSMTLYGMTWQTQGKKPIWNNNQYRGDCFLDDGQVDAKRDLSGGFSDAGDYIKPNYAAAINSYMFSWAVAFFPNSFANSADLNFVREITKHYNDYFVKCTELDNNGNLIRYWHWVSGNDLDHQIGKPAEQQGEEYKKRGWYRHAWAIGVNNEKGVEPCATGAASLAMASLMLRDSDKERSDRYLKYAKALYSFGDNNQVSYKERYVYKSSSGFFDELCLGAIALYMATKEQSYLDKAEKYFNNNVSLSWTFMPDNSSSMCGFMLAYLTGKGVYKQKMRDWTNSWVEGKAGVRIHANGSPLRSNSDWGTIPQSATAFAMFVFAHENIPGMENQSAVDLAVRIMNYCLGDNSKKFSWLAGFGDNYPKNIHHRSTWREGKPVVGTGLWVAGEKQNGEYNDRYDDWITNESGCYNASVAMLVAAVRNK